MMFNHLIFDSIISWWCVFRLRIKARRSMSITLSRQPFFGWGSRYRNVFLLNSKCFQWWESSRNCLGFRTSRPHQCRTSRAVSGYNRRTSINAVKGDMGMGGLNCERTGLVSTRRIRVSRGWTLPLSKNRGKRSTNVTTRETRRAENTFAR